MAAKLGELDRAKEDFFSHISHELRTPLSAVCEAAELLRHQKLGGLSIEQARLVDHITTSTERVLGLVNQILQLSRLREGLLAIEHRSVHLEAVLERALKELHPQAEARGLTLERDGGPSGLSVVGDEGRLLEVVVNLVGNALKFTPRGGRVCLRLAERDDEAEIVVEDTGPGIAPDALPHIFDRYWQVPGTQGGSGLGLAIVKRIVEAHGGRVVAESRPGEGARFTVQLPRERAT
jgi:signal transduction histidine kinase